MENEEVIRLQDFYSAAVVLASKKLPLIRVEKASHKTCVFVFGDSNGKANLIIQNHWNRVNKVISRDLIEAIKELKTRIHTTLYENA
jgi:hypothetical protein